MGWFGFARQGCPGNWGSGSRLSSVMIRMFPCPSDISSSAIGFKCWIWGCLCVAESRGIKLAPGDLDVLYERSALHAEHGSVKKVFPTANNQILTNLGHRWLPITPQKHPLGHDRHPCPSKTLQQQQPPQRRRTPLRRSPTTLPLPAPNQEARRRHRYPL